MEIKRHQCEQVVFHIVGTKCGIQGNKPIVTELQHGLKLCRCLDACDQRDMNRIHLTYILEIKKYH